MSAAPVREEHRKSHKCATCFQVKKEDTLFISLKIKQSYKELEAETILKGGKKKYLCAYVIDEEREEGAGERWSLYMNQDVPREQTDTLCQAGFIFSLCCWCLTKSSLSQKLVLLILTSLNILLCMYSV